MEAKDKLDMSLEDIIRQQQDRRGGGFRGRRRGGIQKPVATGRLGFRRGGRGAGRGPRTLGAGQAFDEPLLDARGKWMKDASAVPLRRRGQSYQPRVLRNYRPVTIPQRQPAPSLSYNKAPPEDKLFLSNLEYRVSERDLLELFSQIGPLRSVRVNYDKSGRSLGTGEVTFEIPIHATVAERRFNGILIDSKPLVIHKSGSSQAGQNTGPTKLSSGITVISFPTHS